MSISLADLLWERVGEPLDGAAPAVGVLAIRQAVEELLPRAVERLAPGQAELFVRRLLTALDTPLPRVLVSGWRRYEELQAFADAEEPAARSGEARLLNHAVISAWEVAPSFDGETLAEPRLQVRVTLSLDAGVLEIRDGRFVGLRAATLTYEGRVRVRDAPRAVGTVGPRRLEIPGGRLDLDPGWPIRPQRE